MQASARRRGGGAIAAGHPITARAGADVLARGGNACDALVAAGVASWAAEPTVTGPCGGGFLVYRDRRRDRVTVLDFFVAVPGLGLRQRVRPMDSFDVQFGTAVQRFHIGVGSTSVPGTTAGLGEAHRRFGSLPWAELVAPAAEIARAGVALTPAHDRLVRILEPVVTATPEARAVFAPEGSLLPVAARIRQPELATTMERLAEAGADDLYRGRLAATLLAFVEDAGGAVTARDLDSYRVIARRPLAVDYRGHRVTTNPPPSSGGVLLAHALAVTAGFPAPLDPLGADAVRLAGAVLRGSEALRGSGFGRDLARGGARRLVSPDGVRRGREAVRAALRAPLERSPVGAVARGTTHISIVDGEGNAAAMTCSTGCGSGVFVPGTGLHLNNMLGEEDLTGTGSFRPGARLTSMMSPSLVEGPDGFEAVVGSSGSARIRSAIYRVVTGLVDHGLEPQAAIDLPRVHPSSDGLDCELGFPDATLDELEAAGEPIVRWPDRNIYFGGAQAAVRRGGRLGAGGDPRRGGAGVVVDP